MEVKIYLNNSEKIASLSLLKDKSYPQENKFQEKKEQGFSFGNIRYRYLSNPHYGIVHLDVNTLNTYEVISEFEGPAIIMAFMQTGSSSCTSNGAEGCICDKQNNIFFNNGLVKCHYKKANFLRIILSSAYVKMLSQMYPETMAPLIDAIAQGRESLFDHSHTSTILEMQQVLKSIENIPLQESNREMFLEAKIRELLCWQINQYVTIKNNRNFNLEKYKENIQTACTYIESHKFNNLSLDNIAMTAGICKTTLKLAFKYFYGKTVFNYINEQRMYKACELLLNPCYGISDIAYKIGYDHPSHFSTAFNQKFGITPLEYRKEHQSNILP